MQLSEVPLGLGDEDFPGFPVDVCPEDVPDLSRHHSTLADVLRRDPSLYRRFRNKRTSFGTGLARCIKVGMDNRGHSMVKTIGLVAGDEECYDAFKEIFDPVISSHLDDGAGAPSCHPTDLGRHGRGLTTVRADSTGKYVLSSQVQVSRSLAGFPFPPAMSREERWEVERHLAWAFSEVQSAMRGDYLPLRGSKSYAPRPGGMRPEEEASLHASGILFEAPDATLKLCTGAGRHWPEGRGVFTTSERNFAIWVNQEEHLRLVSIQQGDAIQRAFREVVKSLDSVAGALRRSNSGFGQNVYAHNDRLGFLTSNPANLGTALGVSVILRLPRLATCSDVDAWKAWCVAQRMQVKPACDPTGVSLPGVFELSNSDRLGISEVSTVNLIIEVVSGLVQMERSLESGERLVVPALECAEPTSPRAARKQASAVMEASQKACGGLLVGLASGRLADAMARLGSEDNAIASAPYDWRGANQQEQASLTTDSNSPGNGDKDAAGVVFESILQSVVPRLRDDRGAEEIRDANTAERIDTCLPDRPNSVLSMSTVIPQSEEGSVGFVTANDMVGSLLDKELDALELSEAGVDTNAGQFATRNEALANVRLDVAMMLNQAASSGELQRALEFCYKDDGGVSVEADSPNLVYTAASNDALPALPSMDSLRGRLHDCLFDALDSGRLEDCMLEAMDSCITDAPEVAAGGSNTVANQTSDAIGGKANAAIDPKAKKGVLKLLSEQDRLIGELTGMIRGAERQIIERTEKCTQLEEMIGAAKVDVDHLSLDAEWHRQALEKADNRSVELQVKQNQLCGELSFHQVPQRSIGDKDPLDGGPSIQSARSELSTATGGTMNSTGMSFQGCYYTPRTPLSTTRTLEPLAQRH